MYEVGVKSLICGYDFGFDAADDFVKVAGREAANLTTHRTTFVPRTEMEELPSIFLEKTKEWRLRFKERFGYWPAWVEVRSYDSVFVLAEAIKRAGSVDREAVREALAGMSSPEKGVVGIAPATYLFHQLEGPEGNHCYYNVPEHLIFQRQDLQGVVNYVIVFPKKYATGNLILP
jgi:hypothetical protein